MSREEAVRQARVKLGGLERTKEECRDALGVSFVESLIQDARFGLRMLRKNPGFTAVAIITLALGIGANTAIFSVFDAILLRPLPYPNADRLVVLWEKLPQIEQTSLSLPDYLDYRNFNRVFEEIAAFHVGDFALPGRDAPISIRGGVVSYNFFETLGVRPLLGRTFSPIEEDLAKGRVAILSFGCWRQYFNGDRHLVGKTIALNGTGYTIVGVLPASFEFALPAYFHRAADIWVPLNTAQNRDRSNHFLRILASRRAGVSLAQATANVREISEMLAAVHPDTNRNESARVIPFEEERVGRVRPALIVLLGSVAFVLMMAVVNVAGLLLARAADREREFGVRVALGAGRWRVTRQLLVEGALLSFSGAIVGIFLAYEVIPVIQRLSPPNIRMLGNARIDFGVLSFTAAISLVAALATGILPARKAWKTNLTGSFNQISPSASPFGARNRTHSILVVAEISASMTLLIGAGLLLRSFATLSATNPGFQSSHVISALISLSHPRYPDSASQLAFFKNVLDGLRATPGVEFASTVDDLPQAGDRDRAAVSLTGDNVPPSQMANVDYRIVGTDYFRVMRIPIYEGRAFSAEDIAGHELTVVVNETFVRRFFLGKDPVGTYLFANFDLPHPRPLARRIVGVVGDVRDLKMNAAPEPAIYAPFAQEATSYALIVALGRGDAAALAAGLRKAVANVDKDQPISETQTMDQVVQEGMGPERFRTTLITVFGGAALFLALVGIYGLMSYEVRRSTREIGIRMALGAQRGDVFRKVLTQGGRVALTGIVVGLIASYGLTQLLHTMLFGVGARDPVTFLVVTAGLLAVALVATYVPARRATRVDPMVALRHE
jgi:putative ABC transport system permease protein